MRCGGHCISELNILLRNSLLESTALRGLNS
uniref:Uncharacterized protein n=1 Tax=Arundo donax TaxID=35708 RepID=A0A0A9BBE7_ARUDO